MQTSWYVTGVCIAALACRGSTSPPATDGELNATIGTSGFVATTVFAGYEDREFTMSAVEENGSDLRSITITIRGVAQTGTFDLARSGNAGSYAEARLDSTFSWMCSTSQGEGTVTISELTDDRIVGTFSFSAPALITSGAMGTKFISEGSFDVRPWRD